MNPQASELNEILKKEGPAAYELLSEHGKNIFFPRKGLVAQGLDAKGRKINASIGEAKEDDGSPLRLSPLAELVNLPPEDIFSYAPSFGKPDLRDVWKKKIKEKNPSLGNAVFSRPVVTNALTHGLSVAAYLFADKNDQIILPHYYWGNYRLIFSEAYGVELKTFETFNGDDVKAGFNIGGMKELLMSEGNKKILLLNFPNNPTGYTPDKDELAEIIDIIKKAAEKGKKILVITDDAYFGLVYDEKTAVESPFAFLAGLHENIVVCKVDGATKEDYVWGFRVGFITFAGKGLTSKALSALEDKAAGRVRGSISNDSHLAQSLLLKAYESPDYSKEKQRAYNLLKTRFELVKNELEKHPEYEKEFKPLPFNSGYFMCVKIENGNAEAVRQRLLEVYDTGVIALGNLIRVAYSSLPASQISELFANLYSACSDVSE